MCYSAGILNWTQAELDDIGHKTRKLLTIYKGLHPKADVDHLYLQGTQVDGDLLMSGNWWQSRLKLWHTMSTGINLQSHCCWLYIKVDCFHSPLNHI